MEQREFNPACREIRDDFFPKTLRSRVYFAVGKVSSRSFPKCFSPRLAQPRFPSSLASVQNRFFSPDTYSDDEEEIALPFLGSSNG